MAGKKSSTTTKKVVQEPVPEQVIEAEPVSSEEAATPEEADKKRVMNAVSKEFLKLVISNLPASTTLSTKDVKTVCEVFVKSLVSQVKTGGAVSFTNNMTFKRVTRDDRTHKNPKTGEEVFKPAHYVMVMEVKQALKKQFEEIPVSKKDTEAVSEEAKSSDDADKE